MKPPIIMPISNRPADPWAGVKGDQPVTFDDTTLADRRWEVRAETTPCTAVHDHCLPPIAWMWVRSSSTGPVRQADIVAFTPDGPTTPNGMRDGIIYPGPYVAYRTVPATHKNLVVGDLAISYGDQLPANNEAVYTDWKLGTIERVEWDLGFVFFAGAGEPYAIAATRVPVLRYEPGGKVTIIGDKKRDQLAVAPAEVILP